MEATIISPLEESGRLARERADRLNARLNGRVNTTIGKALGAVISAVAFGAIPVGICAAYFFPDLMPLALILPGAIFTPMMIVFVGFTFFGIIGVFVRAWMR